MYYMEIFKNYYPAPGLDNKSNKKLFNLHSAIKPQQGLERISQLILMEFSLSKIEVK